MTDIAAIPATHVAAFDGLGAAYSRFRPGYPEALLAQVVALWEERAAPAVALDVGAGTGISTRAWAEALSAKWRVVGLEPNQDMLAQATVSKRGAVVEFRAGQAEELPFEDATFGLVSAAQAVHWFDRPLFYAEAARVLAPGGLLVVVNNDRELDGEGPMPQAEALLERDMPGYSRYYRAIDFEAELDALDWPERVVRFEETWLRPVTPEAFAGLMLSRSKSKPFVARHGQSAAEAMLTALCAPYLDSEGRVPIRYRTRATVALKPA
ncbi:MAG: class I SAM-dependent methyltransferase [Kiloniellales bacterium]